MKKKYMKDELNISIYMENKPDISIELHEEFINGECNKKYYALKIKGLHITSFTESEFEEFKKVFSDFISKQK